MKKLKEFLRDLDNHGEADLSLEFSYWKIALGIFILILVLIWLL